MMKKLLSGFFGLVIIFSIVKIVKAEVYGSISGRVIDQATQQGVENAYIFIGGNRIKSITDKNGNYVFKLMPPGDYELTLDLQFLSDDLRSRYNLEYKKKQVFLKSGTNVLDANFYLEKIGAISGKLYYSDGITPVIGGDVFAFSTTNVSSKRSLFFNEIKYNSTDNMIRDFQIRKVADYSNWQLLYVDRIIGTTSVYLYDSSLEVSNGNDVQNVNFALKPYANTKIYGQLEDKYGNNLSNIIAAVYFYFTKANLTYWCDFDEQGKYILQGDIIPGEYKVIVQVVEFKTDGESVKAMYRDNNGTVLINTNEQKELNLIYDSSRAKKM